MSLWARTADEAKLFTRDGENKRLLPGYPFPPSLKVTSDPKRAFSGARFIVLAVPSRTVRSNLGVLKDVSPDLPVIVSVTKGLEQDTGKRMSQVIEEELGEGVRERLCAMSGPNLSKEVARGQPTTTVAAAYNEGVALSVQSLFNSQAFRVYTNPDVIGVELGGALKNIIALGAGMSDGLGYGDNAKAAFITRGLAEITRLGVAAGANALTFAGLAGLGDLIATCASPFSRNRYVGEQVARGRPLREVLDSMPNVAEGVNTTIAARKLAAQLAVEMPITELTYKVLFEGLPPKEAVAELMGRAPRAE